MRTDPVRGDDLGLQQASGGRAESFREAAEAAALDQPGDADVRAAAALHVAAGLAGHGVIEIDPDGAGFGGDRRRRRDFALAALRREGVVHRHLVHRARPDQQRIRRVRRPLIGVARALHDQAQTIVAGEVHRRRDVGAGSRLHRIGARRRRPGVEPARDLRAAGLVAEIERVVNRGERVRAGGALRVGGAGGEGRFDRDQIAADRLLQLGPAFGARPGGVAGPDAAEAGSRGALAAAGDSQSGCRAIIAAIPLSRLRLCIRVSSLGLTEGVCISPPRKPSNGRVFARACRHLKASLCLCETLCAFVVKGFTTKAQRVSQRHEAQPPSSAFTAASASGEVQFAGPATTPISQPSASISRLVGRPSALPANAQRLERVAAMVGVAL